MKTFEYEYFTIAGDSPMKLVHVLNDLGNKGWEVIYIKEIPFSLGDHMVIAKRENSNET